MKEKKRFYSIFISSTICMLLLGIFKLYEPLGKYAEIYESTENTLAFIMCYGLIIWWALLVVHRVMHSDIKRFIIETVACMLFWILIKEMRWRYVDATGFSRLLWYLYYIPMIFIPLFGFFSALCIGRPEGYSKKRIWNVFYIVATLLVVLVITNDFHELVFSFDDISNYNDYSYGFLYLFIVAWILILEILTVVVMMKRSRLKIKLPHNLWPLGFSCLGFLYCILYWTKAIAIIETVDLTSVFCYVSVMMWEACIYIGLIPSNNNYGAFFHNSSIRAQIVNKNGETYISAKNALNISPEIFNELKERKTKYYNSRTQLFLYDIDCGYIIWQEDIEKLNNMLLELAQNKQELKEGNTLAEEEARVKIRKNQIDEENRLYNMVTEEIKDDFDRIKKLAEKIKQSDSKEECSELIGLINIIGVYLKRRSNFIMISEENKSIPIKEMELCLMEMSKNLAVCGMYFRYTIDVARDMMKEEVMALLDFLQYYIEEKIYVEKSMTILLKEEGLDISITISGENDRLVTRNISDIIMSDQMSILI